MKRNTVSTVEIYDGWMHILITSHRRKHRGYYVVHINSPSWRRMKALLPCMEIFYRGRFGSIVSVWEQRKDKLG